VCCFDLDKLKKINDMFGHLTGSRAIKRLGVALRNDCRSNRHACAVWRRRIRANPAGIGRRRSRKAALRICERLARDGQEPPVTVSAGLAVYPNDGTTIEKLLGAADRALYGMKGRSEKKFRLRHVAACL